MSTSDVIEIADYDPRWPSLFMAEAARVREALGDDLVVALEHIGSTAVPGLAAKPIIDVLAVVRSLAQALSEAVPLLEALGYSFWRDNPAPTHLFFVRGLPPNGPRTHHLHMLEADAPDRKQGVCWCRIICSSGSICARGPTRRGAMVSGNAPWPSASAPTGKPTQTPKVILSPRH